jgi:hypothetical protein
LSEAKAKTTNRASRFEQNPEILALTPFEENVLKAVYEYRLLNTELAVPLLIDQLQAPVVHGKQTGQKILKTLTKLFRAGYLNTSTTNVTEKMTYHVGNKAAAFLKSCGYPEERIKSRSKKIEDLEHTLAISRYHLSLELACRNTPQIQLTHWEQTQSELADAAMVATEKGDERIPLVPDVHHTLLFKQFATKEKPEGLSAHFFVEVDRGTESKAKWQKKIQAYQLYYTLKGHTAKYGIKNFRVLTVTPDERRAKLLFSYTQELDESFRFWFTSEDKFSYELPKNLLDDIWQTTKYNEFHSLLETPSRKGQKE